MEKSKTTIFQTSLLKIAKFYLKDLWRSRNVEEAYKFIIFFELFIILSIICRSIITMLMDSLSINLTIR